MARPGAPKTTLADLMILIAATSFGLGCYVLLDNSISGGQRYLFGLFERPRAGWTSSAVADRMAGAVATMLPVFGGWTFALPVLAARRPRPHRRRLARGPGLTACVASMVGILASVGVTGLAIALRWFVDGATTLSNNFWFRLPILDDLVIFSGVAVASAWGSKAVAGRWRPIPDLVDRAGRFLGLLWIVAGLAFALRLCVR